MLLRLQISVYIIYQCWLCLRHLLSQRANGGSHPVKEGDFHPQINPSTWILEPALVGDVRCHPGVLKCLCAVHLHCVPPTWSNWLFCLRHNLVLVHWLLLVLRWSRYAACRLAVQLNTIAFKLIQGFPTAHNEVRLDGGGGYCYVTSTDVPSCTVLCGTQVQYRKTENLGADDSWFHTQNIVLVSTFQSKKTANIPNHWIYNKWQILVPFPPSPFRERWQFQWAFQSRKFQKRKKKQLTKSPKEDETGGASFLPFASLLGCGVVLTST